MRDHEVGNHGRSATDATGPRVLRSAGPLLLLSGGAMIALTRMPRKTALLIPAGLAAYAVTRRSKDRQPSHIHLQQAVTVNRERPAVYAFWRDLDNLPRVMTHVESITPLGEGRSRWTVKGPLDRAISWEARTTAERDNELISWESMPGSTVRNRGTVEFRDAPPGRGTEVYVSLDYWPPAGPVGAAIARLLGDAPIQQVEEDLRRFKQIIETGQVPTTEGQPAGPRTGLSRIRVERRAGWLRQLVDAAKTRPSRATA